MSYDIRLVNEWGETIELESQQPDAIGGTYQIGGPTEAHLNVTYNYSCFYHWFLDKEEGIRWLYGKKAKDCIERLEAAIAVLGTKKHSDYWAQTPGNAGFALSILLRWAKAYPEGVFRGD